MSSPGCVGSHRRSGHAEACLGGSLFNFQPGNIKRSGANHKRTPKNNKHHAVMVYKLYN